MFLQYRETLNQLSKMLMERNNLRYASRDAEEARKKYYEEKRSDCYQQFNQAKQHYTFGKYDLIPFSFSEEILRANDKVFRQLCKVSADMKITYEQISAMFFNKLDEEQLMVVENDLHEHILNITHGNALHWYNTEVNPQYYTRQLKEPDEIRYEYDSIVYLDFHNRPRIPNYEIDRFRMRLQGIDPNLRKRNNKSRRTCSPITIRY